jgi:glutathione gamma-glutamylcysteinyltransferase
MSRRGVKVTGNKFTTFHRRQLPDSLIQLSAPKGRVMFKEALLKGDMECFFPLSEQFITQSEPALCSLSSLGN